MILGVMAMAGPGSRLGMPFPKPLMPVPAGDVIRPLYSFAEERLGVVADTIARMVAPGMGGYFPVPVTEMPADEPHTQPDCYRLAAQLYTEEDDDLVAIALPDSVWFPSGAFLTLRHELAADDDGIVGLFPCDGRVLDEVAVDTTGHVRSITYHGADDAEEYRVLGWGALLLRAPAVRAFRGGANMVENLSGLRLRTHTFSGPYFDLGTQRRWLDFVAWRAR